MAGERQGKKSGLLFAACVLCWLIIIIALLFTVLRGAINSESALLGFYEEYNTQEKIGISPEDCTRAMTRMVDYMDGDAESIQLTVVENGVEVDMFNRQEIDHMVDVRTLYQFFRGFRPAAAVAFLFICAACCITRSARLLFRPYFAAQLLFVAVVAVLGVWVAVDFTSFWTAFHHLFFTNDLWLMDYATCRMIRICPEIIFYGITVKFALRTLMLLGGATLLFALLNARLARRADNDRKK